MAQDGKPASGWGALLNGFLQSKINQGGDLANQFATGDFSVVCNRCKCVVVNIKSGDWEVKPHKCVQIING